MWALPSTMSFQVSNMYLLGMFHGWPLAQHSVTSQVCL